MVNNLALFIGMLQMCPMSQSNITHNLTRNGEPSFQERATIMLVDTCQKEENIR